ncbi:dioxygenase [Geodermatophilus sabuli]|uniref:Protocatechuate 3,4-dioxygenase beta subunit n=1 Tax=Geodermatophilus sabuli TaxID=1564158 RepID=A0A285EH42_9ACTN|nr:dioxygenase [Geodermatophilus sabuli]MBB3086419.1 catechol 1,2-dioxygenase [Geodermatophilus sabuli]SNX97366.1 Protocatechuate 3,4-dioxygenase beta subunit [Geodermatophilus sabuli]
MTTTGHVGPTAAGSGANATESFRSNEQYRGASAVSPERVSAVVSAALAGVHQAIRDQDVTHPEFQAAKAWMIEVGEGGEWPPFLDVFVEHDEQGTPLVLAGQVRDVDGTPLAGAEVDLWQAESEGYYSVHLHLLVRAPGHRTITTQLYFAGGEWLDSDVAEATKPELVLDPQEQDDGTRAVTYDFALEPEETAAA